MGEPVRVVFLDGLGCNPDGFKPRFIAGLGYRVTAPLLPDLDFPAAVAEADRAIGAARPGVVVGYSRGASVALSASDRLTPRLLIAPALHWIADGRGFDGTLVILHSATDDALPLDEVRAHLDRCGLAGADLRVVGEDHTMIDPPALAALAVALDELTKGDLHSHDEHDIYRSYRDRKEFESRLEGDPDGDLGLFRASMEHLDKMSRDREVGGEDKPAEPV